MNTQLAAESRARTESTSVKNNKQTSTFQDWIDDQSLSLNDVTFNEEMKIRLYKLTVRKNKMKVKKYQAQWN